MIFDLAPQGVVDVAGDRLPPRTRRAYERYRHGPGAYKVDLAVEGGVPWANEACRRAGTVHCAGPLEELAAAERDVNRGRMPARPLVLVAQQYLADPGRSSGDVHPVWAYAHVPAGYDGDAEATVIGQIERFAPGLRERIVATSVRAPADLHAANANYIGGDIVNGANGPIQVLIRPRLALDPYATGIPGVFICSAATPPGGGVHGMCGYNAAPIGAAPSAGSRVGSRLMAELIDEFLEDGHDRMHKSVEATRNELATVRTGRASPALLDRIEVDYYGAATPLKQLAQVNATDVHLLTLTPYDKSSMSMIEKAIMESDLGLTPTNDGNVIRLQIPELTEERRKDLVRVVHGVARGGPRRGPQHPPRRHARPARAEEGGRRRRGRGAPRRVRAAEGRRTRPSRRSTR